MSSRKIEDLLPNVQIIVERFKAGVKAEGLDMLITCTYRTWADQTALYAQGRTIKSVPVVTNAKAGYSWHNWRRAVDIVPMRAGKPIWTNTSKQDIKLWKDIADIGIGVGLEWAGNWKTFKEMPHFQYTEGLQLKDLIQEER